MSTRSRSVRVLALVSAGLALVAFGCARDQVTVDQLCTHFEKIMKSRADDFPSMAKRTRDECIDYNRPWAAGSPVTFQSMARCVLDHADPSAWSFCGFGSRPTALQGP